MENICTSCNKQFSSKASLNLHLKTNTCKKSKDKNMFECEYCNKVLSSKQMLIYHIESCIQKSHIELKKHYENKIENYKLLYENKIKKLEVDMEDLLKNKNILELHEICRKCRYFCTNKNLDSICSIKSGDEINEIDI